MLPLLFTMTSHSALEMLGFRRSSRVLIVAAHPDDETVGAGAALRYLDDVHVTFVTDGAPSDLRDARRNGFALREHYAEARTRESEAALAVAGIERSRIFRLEYVDQDAWLNLLPLTRRLSWILEKLQPECVLTHPYEGGHPDHDSTCFAVQAACRMLRKRVGHVPSVIEFTSYHDCAGRMAAGKFLAAVGVPEVKEFVLPLAVPERDFKHRMLDCYESQRDILGMFPLDAERFRFAPRYDFEAPPHPGPLFYERMNWGVQGERWRELARRTLKALEFQGALS